MENLVEVSHLSKAFSGQEVISDISFTLSGGQVLGLLGHNGAGKSTLIKILLGTLHYDGEVALLGLTPEKHRTKIMERVAYISDVSSLPSWMTIKQIINYMKGVHPQFDADRAKSYLQNTELKLQMKIVQLSKGMKVQLNLALVMATDAQILILDEPTLGLDLIYRETFYHDIQSWVQKHNRSMIIASHEVSEIEHLLTDVLVLKSGDVVLQGALDSLYEQYISISIPHENREKAEQYCPIYAKEEKGHTLMLFNNESSEALMALGQVSKTRLSDLFLAKQLGLNA
ncbi:ABC transporter ATP-binding protein [Photobacterium sanguinicancri]|uniref:ABC transporter ATP-binding protein n=1 Tax=Photobacterium sanguinicancri TaxID=875932 RepID=UPI00248156E4|nr:ABC transporter ATP-binding protein [Photobacterium sanguinicancri]